MTHENIQREQRVLLKTGSRRDRGWGGGLGDGEWRQSSFVALVAGTNLATVDVLLGSSLLT